MRGPAGAVYAWLAANGINEPLPEDPTIVVAGNRIIYTSFVWLGPPGWDAEHMHPDGDTITRTVPLLQPPDDEVADILAELELFAAQRGRTPVVR